MQACASSVYVHVCICTMKPLYGRISMDLHVYRFLSLSLCLSFLVYLGMESKMDKHETHVYLRVYKHMYICMYVCRIRAHVDAALDGRELSQAA